MGSGEINSLGVGFPLRAEAGMPELQMLVRELSTVILTSGLLRSEDKVQPVAPAVEEGRCELHIALLGDFLGGPVERDDMHGPGVPVLKQPPCEIYFRHAPDGRVGGTALLGLGCCDCGAPALEGAGAAEVEGRVAGPGVELAGMCESGGPEVEGFGGGFRGVERMGEAGVLAVHVEFSLELGEDGLEELVIAGVDHGLADGGVTGGDSFPVVRELDQGSAFQTFFVEAAKKNEPFREDPFVKCLHHQAVVDLVSESLQA